MAAMRKPTTSIRLSGRTRRATRTGIPRAPAPVCRASRSCRRCRAAGDPAAGGMVDPGRTPFPSSQPMTASAIRPSMISVEASLPGGRQLSPAPDCWPASISRPCKPLIHDPARHRVREPIDKYVSIAYNMISSVCNWVETWIPIAYTGHNTMAFGVYRRRSA